MTDDQKRLRIPTQIAEFDNHNFVANDMAHRAYRIKPDELLSWMLGHDIRDTTNPRQEDTYIEVENGGWLNNYIWGTPPTYYGYTRLNLVEDYATRHSQHSRLRASFLPVTTLTTMAASIVMVFVSIIDEIVHLSNHNHHIATELPIITVIGLGLYACLMGIAAWLGKRTGYPAAHAEASRAVHKLDETFPDNIFGSSNAEVYSNAYEGENFTFDKIETVELEPTTDALMRRCFDLHPDDAYDAARMVELCHRYREISAMEAAARLVITQRDTGGATVSEADITTAQQVLDTLAAHVTEADTQLARRQTEIEESTRRCHQQEQRRRVEKATHIIHGVAPELIDHALGE